MRYGKFLPEGGTIGFVAPSFGCNIEPYRSAFDNAQKIWKAQGYALDLGPNAYAGEGIGISNTPVLCAEEFTAWYRREDNDVLISCGGGELMCGILEYIDWEVLKAAEPKWFMGYSDNTNITFLLATLCDTASIYGPCAATFGMEPWHQCLHDAMAMLRGEKTTVTGYDLFEIEGLKSKEEPLLPYNVTEPRRLRCFVDGEMHEAAASDQIDIQISGRLLGGCLDSLVTLCGTKFDRVKTFCEKYKEDGIIWYLEACDLNMMGIRRAMWQLSQAGWFDTAKGFIIGRPYMHGEVLFGLDQYDAVTKVLKRYDVPIIMDADVGHLPPMMPLICGSKAEVQVKGNDIQVAMELN